MQLLDKDQRPLHRIVLQAGDLLGMQEPADGESGSGSVVIIGQVSLVQGVARLTDNSQKLWTQLCEAYGLTAQAKVPPPEEPSADSIRTHDAKASEGRAGKKTKSIHTGCMVEARPLECAKQLEDPFEVLSRVMHWQKAVDEQLGRADMQRHCWVVISGFDQALLDWVEKKLPAAACGSHRGSFGAALHCMWQPGSRDWLVSAFCCSMVPTQMRSACKATHLCMRPARTRRPFTPCSQCSWPVVRF